MTPQPFVAHEWVDIGLSMLKRLASPRWRKLLLDMKPSPLLPHEFAERSEQIKYILQNLEAAYGLPRNTPEDPLDELILTILSQATNDQNSRRAFANLRRRFPTWEAVRRARPATIAAAIKSGGLAQAKSIVIKNALNEIKTQRGELDLSFLRTAPLAEAKAFLTALKGVGPKTAACVLLFAFARPVFPMDTHIFRILRRVGLIPARGSDEQAHELMLALIPPGKHYSLHINLIRHGRRLCRPRNPQCLRCCLVEQCQYGQTQM
jgi:endonuclease-3